MIDIVSNSQSGVELNYQHYFPSTGYSPLSFSIPQYINPPLDYIQDINIIGGEMMYPGQIVLPVIVPFVLNINFKPYDWALGFRLSGKALSSPILIMRTLRDAKPIAQDELLVHSCVHNGKSQLSINGSYTGGSTFHKFQLSVNGPGIAELSHDSNKDTGKAIIQFTLLFDLTPHEKILFNGFTGFFELLYPNNKKLFVPFPPLHR